MRNTTRIAVLLLLALSPTPAALAAEPSAADALLKLVPADAGATLVVSDLRAGSRAILESPLAEGFRRLPAVRAWLTSDQAGQLARSRRDIEMVLGTSLTTLRDDLLGDAVALSLRLPPGAAPDQAEGMLLTRFRDRALLEALIERVNQAEQRDGGLVKVVPRQHRSAAYSVRTFRPGTKPDDVFAILSGDVFVWSNSEALIRATIDRAIEGGGLAGEPRFQKVRAGLPPRALAALYIDPKVIARIAASEGGSAKATDDPPARLLRRYVEAIDYAGLAIEWRDGVIVHLHESLDPARLDEPLRRWAARPGEATALLRRVPPTAPLLAAGHADFTALGDLAMGLVPEVDRTRAENVLTALRGVFLGLDVREAVLPRLGPGLLAYVDAPAGASTRWPVVVALGLGGSPEDHPSIASALDNALRTLLALAALDAKASAMGARVVSRDVQGVRVTSLVGGPGSISYAVGTGFFAVGTTPEAVAAFASEPPAGGNPRLEALRAAYYPAFESYLAADVESLLRLAETRREALASRLAAGRDGDLAAARRDLDGALALAGLFRAAFLASRIEPDATAAHRVLGLIAR